jgi:ribosomal protein S18 acetylase RimI-like enzyme
MEIRDIRANDVKAIASVAIESLRESYGHFVGEQQIDELVEQWYDPDRIEGMLSEESAVWRVAVDDEVVGFAQAKLLDSNPVTGEIDWLHVAPDARGEGIGRQLLGAIHETLEERGAERLQGLVLTNNEGGSRFYEVNGFEHVGDREVTIEDESYPEHVYEKPLTESAQEAVVEAIGGPDGELFVNYSEGGRGSDAPFYPTYRTRDFEGRYGWYCSNCDSLDNAMDAMGRIECNECGNQRKATRWDSSYL